MGPRKQAKDSRKVCERGVPGNFYLARHSYIICTANTLIQSLRIDIPRLSPFLPPELLRKRQLKRWMMQPVSRRETGKKHWQKRETDDDLKAKAHWQPMENGITDHFGEMYFPTGNGRVRASYLR